MTDHDRFDRPLARAARPDGRDSTDGCLDAGTLAAWADGTLRPSERAAAEAHAADCERCLQLLATMVRTEPPPSIATPRAWFSMRWLLVPMTTAAVAITAWVIVRDPALMPPPALETLASPPPSSAAAPPSEAAKQIVPEARRDRDRPQDLRQKKDEQKERDVTPARPDAAATKPAADSLSRNAAELRGADAPASAVPATPSFRAEASRENLDQVQAQAAITPRIILSPEPAVQWRLSGRAVEATRDGGTTWHPQLTAPADLRAGASPAPGTCWIVGRSGLVLLSTDGQTWRTATSPDRAADLVSVTATDARTATVTTADGRTYRTVDGGQTWTLQEIPAAPF